MSSFFLIESICIHCNKMLLVFANQQAEAICEDCANRKEGEVL